MHLSGENRRSPEKFTELDFYLKYSVPVDIVTLTAGHYWYLYPDADDDLADTAEVFAGISLDVPLSPSLTFYQDYREFDNQYYDLSFSHQFKDGALGEGFNVTPFVSFGFASNADKVYEDDGLETITVGASSEAALGDISIVLR